MLPKFGHIGSGKIGKIDEIKENLHKVQNKEKRKFKKVCETEKMLQAKKTKKNWETNNNQEKKKASPNTI